MFSKKHCTVSLDSLYLIIHILSLLSLKQERDETDKNTYIPKSREK